LTFIEKCNELQRLRIAICNIATCTVQSLPLFSPELVTPGAGPDADAEADAVENGTTRVRAIENDPPIGGSS
jgi:hypothetical protein